MSDTPASPPFPGQSGYTWGYGGFVTSIPKDRLCGAFAAQALASVLSVLYGKTVTVGPDPNFPNPRPAGPLAPLAVTVPDEGTINAQYLIAQQSAPYGDGSPSGMWKLDPNGGPEWEHLDEPKPPAPVPVQNPPNNFPGFDGAHPTIPTTTDIWNALALMKTELDQVNANTKK